MRDIAVTINQREVLKYLGYKGGKVDGKLLADVDKISEEVISCAKPRVTYKVFDIDIRDGFSLTGTVFVPGGSQVQQLLEDSSRCVVFGATLGIDIDRKIESCQVMDMYRALIMDCCASSAIEGVCDSFCESLQGRLTGSDRFLTDRFSPGYGDMPFSQQKDICNLLQTEKTIGVNLSSTGIMIPRKSVTALLGISDQEQKRRFRGCEYCSIFENCDYRKGGTTCGDE